MCTAVRSAFGTSARRFSCESPTTLLGLAPSRWERLRSCAGRGAEPSRTAASSMRRARRQGARAEKHHGNAEEASHTLMKRSEDTLNTV